ncbi:MAG: DegQ family serine endoprotease [Gammaproteobacteria bacterium]|nr:DegQ family serine endoprotease [Gammaproteobacteria bacterium]MBU1725034.1 DegQ family serine endoprotease [Gammaproteobacteria bacterium]MBU2005103.1 DegQ family serine endoprotease [Gammaproteobacteria bacterium]
MRQNKLALAVGLLMCSALTAGSLPALAEVAPTTAAATPAPVVAPPVAGGSLPELTTLIKQNSAAVVNISVEGGSMASELPEGIPPELAPFFRGMPEMKPKGRTRASGSGFIVSADGYIVTNAHVVEDAESVSVGLSDKRDLPAEIVGVDKLSDIALLKVKADNLPVVQMGDSNILEVGQWVVAIGAPFGLDHTATQGIVSALSRSLPDGTYVPFIQTDVAVNPGNSGGPLFDLNGRVVGVNSQIYSRSGGYMGISFAIPINVAKNVVEQLKTSGQVSRGWLGVEIQDMDQGLASSFNLNQPDGALVASVQPGSPADKAGLQAGDIITGFGEGVVNSASDLPLLVGNTPVGKQVPVKILRAGMAKTVNVTIDKLASKDGEPAKLADAKVEKGMLGVLVSGMNADELKSNKLDNGVMVQEVLGDSPAEQAGLEKGDIIISVNNNPIHTAEELKSVLSSAPADKPLAMLVMQDGQTRFIAVNKKL